MNKTGAGKSFPEWSKASLNTKTSSIVGPKDYDQWRYTKHRIYIMKEFWNTVAYFCLITYDP
jgi:hypothetical protein